MPVLIISQVVDRAKRGRADSDAAYFDDLMYLGEAVIKTAAAGLVASIDDDKDRSRYRHAHTLVRADGIGEWAGTIEEILTGPSAQFLTAAAQDEKRELLTKVTQEAWQWRAVDLMHKSLSILDGAAEPPGAKTDGRSWFKLFARLRNKSRGHGAPPSELVSKIVTHLSESIGVFSENFRLFRREWAFLHRNLSGKYRVTRLSDTSADFDSLRASADQTLPNGVYVSMGGALRAVPLVASTSDALDFYFPNGNFSDKRFELLSYATGSTKFQESANYLMPAGALPGSETGGKAELEVLGNCFGNVPLMQKDYIRRDRLENELATILRHSDRHPIVTLVGPGGIGKTSLALSAVHQVASEERFSIVLWLSARDLDLLPEGPKRVRPSVLSIKDVAGDVVKLLGPSESREKAFKAIDYVASQLGKSEHGPILFVFDNFETVSNPGEFYEWIDTHVRHPNKVLITTREREFKGDYPLDVKGMTEIECEKLVDQTASRLGIGTLLTHEYRATLIRESDAHPYVVKILLGEVAKAGKLIQIERIVADADDILTALFERTFNHLSPAAQRVFLTLSSWRATVPVLALEAVLLRPQNEKIAVREAIDELERNSFVELTSSPTDRQLFVTTPLAAAIFGRRKLSVSAMKAAIEADNVLLHEFGAAQKSDVRHGVAPRAQRLFRYVVRRVQGGDSLDEFLPVLEYIANKFPPAWLMLADLYEEQGAVEKTKSAVRRFLELATDIDSAIGWRRLAAICRRDGDFLGEINSLVALSEVTGVALDEISDGVNRLNYHFAERALSFGADEKVLLAQKMRRSMESRLGSEDATATDYSRLAWLAFHMRDQAGARKYVSEGLKIDPDNDYCLRLYHRIAKT